MNDKKLKSHLIVEAGWQSTKVRLLTLPLMIGGAVGMYLTPWLLTSLADVDGNQEPLSARLALATLVGAVSLLCTIGLWCYQSVYVAKLERMGDAVLVHTQGLLWPGMTTLQVADFRSASEHSGRLNIPVRVWVNAPFRTLAIEGWWLPLLIDDQSRHLDRAALDQIIRDSANMRRRNAYPETEALRHR